MPSTDLIAIDIAILPPDEVAARAQAVNQALLAQAGDPNGLRLDDTHLAHVTLVQLFIRKSNLSAMLDRVSDVLRGQAPIALRVPGVEARDGVVHLAIEPTPKLQRLHEALMDSVAPFEAAAGGPEAFYEIGDAPARQKDIDWVTHYRRRSSYARFEPHITLGHGALPAPIAPFEFIATRVAACQLGRFCTCRLVVRDWMLGGGRGSGLGTRDSEVER